MRDEEFVEAVQKYKRDMYRLAYFLMKNDADAQDAVSEAVVKAYEKKSLLKDEDKVRPWLIRIAVNTAKNMIKKQHHCIPMESVPEPEPAGVFSRSEMLDIISHLEYNYRVVVILYYYEDLSVKEISKVLHVPEGTIKSRLARARDKLRELL